MAGKERGADAPGDGAEAQVEAGGLDLVVADRGIGGKRAGFDQLAQVLRGQHPGCRHGVPPTARSETARTARGQAGGFSMVGPERFELSTSRPPDGRANQAALWPDTRPSY